MNERMIASLIPVGLSSGGKCPPYPGTYGPTLTGTLTCHPVPLLLSPNTTGSAHTLPRALRCHPLRLRGPLPLLIACSLSLWVIQISSPD